MKKFILTFLIISLGLAVLADGEPPQMRPAAPDVPSQPMNSSDYTPGVVKQSEDVQVKQETQDNDYDYVEGGGNAKDKNFESVQNSVNKAGTADNKTKNAVNKNQKKEKDPYKGYKGASDDSYLNSLNEATTSDAPAAAKTYSQDDYEKAYRDMQVPTFSYVHGVDPDQYYDMKDTMWSPYPLMRLNSPIYFKTITVEPGYYLLTPREYKGSWYVLFKEAGAVKYTIPVMAKDYTPEFYYKDNLPELDMKKSQRWQIKFLNAWGKYVRKSKRKPAITSNIELTDLDNNFLLIELYYGPHKYSMIFRIEKF